MIPLNRFKIRTISLRWTKEHTPYICNGSITFLSLQQLKAPILNLMPLLQSLITWACKQGIKSKAGEIKRCTEIKMTAPPNEWCNIPFCYFFSMKLNSESPFEANHWLFLASSILFGSCVVSVQEVSDSKGWS